jgi:hypothetical protein
MAAGLAALATLALAAVELRHRSAIPVFGSGPEAPIWIWRNHDLRHVQAAGFYAIKEVELSAVPAEAEIRILGDAEYILTLNGTRIGSNRYLSGATLDRYRVERWLQTGRNRLVVELRSPTGAGGFWLELRGAGEPLARSDGSWTIYQGHWRGLYGRRPMPPGGQPRLLGRSPLGRWGSPGSGPLRPVFEEVLDAQDPLAAVSWRPSGSSGPWQPLARPIRRPRSLGPLAEFDFGVERTGYLQLAYRQEGERSFEPGPSAALVAFSDEPIGARRWTADLVFHPIPGSGLFQDSTARRFRYVAVAALPGVFSAEVLAIDEAGWSALHPRETEAAGVLGIRPPPSSAPVEHEVWRELQRSPGFVVGKER